MFEWYQRVLEKQVNSGQCKESLDKIKSEYSIFNFHPAVESLCILFKPGNKNYSHKDEIMAILLREFHRDKVIYPLINLIFWNSLYSLYCQRRFRNSDLTELFTKIQEEFYQSLMNHNLERLPQKVDVNIILNVKKRIIAWEGKNLGNTQEQRELEKTCKELYTERLKAKKTWREITEEANAIRQITPFDFWKSNIYPEEMESFLLDMVYKKIISEIQFELLRETLVFKRMSQKEWADKKGIPEGTVRSLRLRAKVAIIEFIKKNKKS